ncbi:MAG: hypothetical protein J4F41_04390, partial [Alphaproteobacteria bacterium]|nr:hypothetical protein [Alphaproteobacteria bacterium]
IVVFIILFGVIMIEVLTQKYLVSPELRTSYYGVPGYEWFSDRVLIRGELLLPQGPFTWNHTLSGITCVGMAIALWAMDKHKIYGLIFAYALFILNVIAGVRAGTGGCLIAITLYAIWIRRPLVLVDIMAAILVANLAFLVLFDKHLPIFFSGDLSAACTHGIPVHQETQDAFADQFNAHFSSELIASIESLGTVGVKIAGFLMNLMNIENWWAFGYGFASFQRPLEVTSSAIQYNDPGIVQLIFLECGLLAGGMFIFILIRAVLIGLKYKAMEYYSVGITAWAIFALSSWEVWPVGFVMLFVLMIHRYHHLHREDKPAP